MNRDRDVSIILALPLLILRRRIIIVTYIIIVILVDLIGSMFTNMVRLDSIHYFPRLFSSKK